MLLAELRPCAAPPLPGLSRGSWCLRHPRPPAGRTKGPFLAPGWVVRGCCQPGAGAGAGPDSEWKGSVWAERWGQGPPSCPGCPRRLRPRPLPSQPRSWPRSSRRPWAGVLWLQSCPVFHRVGRPATPGHSLFLDIAFLQPGESSGHARWGWVGECWQNSLCPTGFFPSTRRGPPRKPSPAPWGLEHCVARWRGTRQVWP